MRAISGIVGEEFPDKDIAVANMLATMKHRGPDHTEVRKVGDHTFLGHNRLSIIDLHSSANQPFVSEDDRYTIVFNGEIYNYTELSYNFSLIFPLEQIQIQKYYWPLIESGDINVLITSLECSLLPFGIMLRMYCLQHVIALV